MEQNSVWTPSKDELEVAEIIAQFPILIFKSNLPLFFPVWKKKGRRSAINVSPSPPPPPAAAASRPDQLPPCENSATPKEVQEEVLPNPEPVNGVSCESERGMDLKDDDPPSSEAQQQEEEKKDVPVKLELGSATCSGKRKSEKISLKKDVVRGKVPTSKERNMELRMKIEQLHGNKRILLQQIEQVEAYYQKLMEYSLKLKARREELLSQTLVMEDRSLRV